MSESPIANHVRQFWPRPARKADRRFGSSVAISAILLIFQCACGAAANEAWRDTQVESLEPSGPQRYVDALRSAALGRVEMRAGQDAVAGEHFRRAYRSHAEVGFLLAYADAAERAGLFAESSEAAQRALLHPLDDDLRLKVQAQVTRLQPQIVPGLIAVAVNVRPENARVELSQSATDGQKRLRIVIGPSKIFLQPGTWSVESTSKGFNSEMRTFQVGGPEGNLLAIALQVEDNGPALVGTPHPDQPEKLVKKPIIPEKKPDVVMKTPDPDEEPEETPLVKAPEIKPTPRDEKGPIVTYEDKNAPPKRSFLHKWGPIATSALGVAALGGGGFFGYRATQSGNDANALSPADKNYTNLLNQKADSATANAKLATYSFIGGGVLLAAGALWMFFAPTAEVPPPPPTGKAAKRVTPVAPTFAEVLLPSVGVSPGSVSFSWKF